MEERWHLPTIDSLSRTTDAVRTGSGGNAKLTPKRVRVVLQAFAEGHSIRVAAMRAGIAALTVKIWLRKGREGTDPAYVEFLQNYEWAQAIHEEENLQNIADAANGEGRHKTPQWTASAWQLERKYPEEYARRQVTRHEGHDGGPIKFKMSLDRASAISDNELEPQQLERPEPIEVPSEVVA
jgi:transposase